MASCFITQQILDLKIILEQQGGGVQGELSRCFSSDGYDLGFQSAFEAAWFPHKSSMRSRALLFSGTAPSLAADTWKQQKVQNPTDSKFSKTLEKHKSEARSCILSDLSI